ncbi:MAG TPA: SLBB domain-containing protein [Armatimonadota bacterium]|nr:SLBB domain-containing protein [Armatimonadota bacterium]
MLCRMCLQVICLFCAFVILYAEEQPAAYHLGQQDEITVTVLRHDELSKTFTVPPDGFIDFPRAGQINVIGKTTSELSALLRERYAEYILNPEVTVTLFHARMRSVFILGAVNKPGQYPLTGVNRLTEIIATAGDLTWDVKEVTANLNRKSTIIPLDLQIALKSADSPSNLVLEDGDVIWIVAPPRITVTILGQVKNPGAVKIREGSTPIDALAMAGDILERPDRVRITLLSGATAKTLFWGDNKTILKDGDVIQVEREQQVRVYINGQVKNPSAYDLPDGGGVLEAIALAGGALPNAALGQVTIIRRSDGSKQRVNLSQTLAKGNVGENPILYSGDQVIVPEWSATISVWGKVKNAGKYPISESDPVTVTDAISMAGGSDKRARLTQVCVIRVVNNKPQRIPVDVEAIVTKGKYELNIPLKDGDIVVVPETDHPDWGGLLDNLAKLGILAGAL